MASFKKIRSAAFVIAIAFSSAATANSALVYHYDPATGDVSFDTTNTRTGKLYVYSLNAPSGVEFRSENLLHLGQSTIEIDATPHYVGDFKLSDPWRGVYTIGPILPPGLDEETWASFYTDVRDRNVYTDAIGREERRQGSGIPRPSSNIDGFTILPFPAEFVYGKPAVEYQNQWDLVDPDDLDWADEAHLIYREMTGELILETSSGDAGGHITGFNILSNGEFLSENFTPPFENPLSTVTSTTIGFFADALEPDTYNLGQLLEPGLSTEEYLAVITKTEFFGRIGFGSNPVALSTEGAPLALVYQAVPEPTHSLLLMGIIPALILRHRRRIIITNPTPTPISSHPIG